MLEFLQDHEPQIRLASFAGLLILFSGLEALFPKKKRTQKRAGRWFTNLALVGVSNVLIRVLFPIAAIGAAGYASSRGWGLLNHLKLSLWLELLIALILLDFSIYWQHVASHKIPILWRLHKMHHADRDIDATSGNRFHPVEIILSLLYKMLIVLIVGPAMVAVLVFEIILNGSAMFNHANLRLPRALDKSIRYLFVTPDMHRVHHSVLRNETDSNYGFNLSIWDRLFGSYNDQPAAGHDGMTIGLPDYQTDAPAQLLWCLKLPFSKK